MNIEIYEQKEQEFMDFLEEHDFTLHITKYLDTPRYNVGRNRYNGGIKKGDSYVTNRFNGYSKYDVIHTIVASMPGVDFEYFDYSLSKKVMIEMPRLILDNLPDELTIEEYSLNDFPEGGVVSGVVSRVALFTITAFLIILLYTSGIIK